MYTKDVMRFIFCIISKGEIGQVIRLRLEDWLLRRRRIIILMLADYLLKADDFYCPKRTYFKKAAKQMLFSLDIDKTKCNIACLCEFPFQNWYALHSYQANNFEEHNKQIKSLPNQNAVHEFFGYKIHPSSDTHIVHEKEYRIYLIQLKITCAYKLIYRYVQNFK